MLSVLAAHAASTVLLSASPAPMADVFVDIANANCGTGTGSAGSPVCSITAAISIAAPGDTIRIAAGTYFENVAIGFDLDLIGTAGAGATVVDGGAAGTVVTIPAAVTVVIDGLTLQNGLATEGGGINVEGNLTLSNSTVTTSQATGDGGGGIGSAAGFGMLTITNSTITGNTATTMNGGGINAPSGTLVISGSNISGNTAFRYGGGVTLGVATATITDSTISGNQVSIGYGGGIEVSGNSSLTLRGSTISGNMALSAGGGMDVFNGTFDIENCTFSGNTAGYGGGLNAVSPAAGSTLVNTTITANTANYSFGGGLFSSLGSLEVRNTIIAQNIATDVYYADRADVDGVLTSLGYNLIGVAGAQFVNGVNGDQLGTTALPLDALLGPLADNGGPTFTHDPAATSPALNASDPVTFAATDQRGIARPQGPGPDIGAVESGGPGLGTLCNGDGGNQMGCTNCPCANNAPIGSVGGCLNSSGNGTRLSSTGSTSVSLPSGDTTDLRFAVATHREMHSAF